MSDALFVFSICLHLVSILFYLNGDKKIALLLLIGGGVLLRIHFSLMANYLYDWDERFHALVAKNFSKHWLIPTLIDKPFLPYDPTRWSEAHVWLHKQPLFLWQMALSIKLFGTNILAVRLPSLIMSSIMIPVIYRMGKEVYSERVGFIAAFMLSCYEPVLELNSGLACADHNDMAFLFYITLSIYCWVCFEKKQQAKYLYMMGFFSGMAILNKWLAGLMVFSSFGFYHLFFLHDFFTRKTVIDFSKSIVVCLLTFLPWQLYIHYRFPVEANFESSYNSLHFLKALEGHQGDAGYYIDLLKNQYKHLEIFIALGISISLVMFNRYRIALSLMLTMVLVYIFFSAAGTKMPNFVIIVAPINILFIAFSADAIIGLMRKWVKAGVVLQLGLFTGIFYLMIDPSSINEMHYEKSNWRGISRSNKEIRVNQYKKLDKVMTKDVVIVNFAENDNIDCMFYIDNTCYPEISHEQYMLLKRSGHRVYFASDTIPEYAKADSTVRTINGLYRVQ